MADYSKYSIVAEEQCVYVENVRLFSMSNSKRCNEVMLRVCTQQTSWEFMLTSTAQWDNCISVKNVHKDNTTPMLAEVMIWKWDDTNEQKIVQKCLFNQNEGRRLHAKYLDSGVYFTIRLLGNRKLADDICPPLNYLAFDDAFSVSVGKQTFVVSAQRLMQVSPVFRAMLTNEMSEKASRKVEVKDAEPEHFRAFLEVIDPDQNVQPNPTNVIGVLQLADRYQVKLAKDRCEAHLLNCVEIPLIDRLQLADVYGFNKLKKSILSIGSVKLRALYKANDDKFKNGQFSSELLDELNSRT